jgi:hypothetical protein
MKDYILRISLRFQSLDDVAAREWVDATVGDGLREVDAPVEETLHEIYPNKQPRPVRLTTKA